MISTSTRRILGAPIQEWPQCIRATRGNLQEIESELAALVQRAALLHEYILHRYNTGCGEQGHANSARAANRTLVKVRKALGYSYPKRVPFGIQE